MRQLKQTIELAADWTWQQAYVGRDTESVASPILPPLTALPPTTAGRSRPLKATALLPHLGEAKRVA